MNKPLYIPTHKSGFAHPKCYLNFTNGCSDGISGEHTISASLLDKVESERKAVEVVGLTWLPKDRLSAIGKSSLVANVLCSKHNSDLSPLDALAGRFIESIGAIDAELQKDAPAELKYSFDGPSLERWVIKTMLGLVHSRQIAQRSGTPFLIKQKCFDLLCSPVARWPFGWGLYASLPEEKVHHSSSFELIPSHNPETGELVSVKLKFNGIEFTFLMGRPDSPGSFGIHRPNELVFVKGGVNCSVALKWGAQKAGKPVVLTHAGTYAGTSPDHVFPPRP